MIYTNEELKAIILPILDTLTTPDAGPRQVNAAADAIVEIIQQDREARDESPR